MVVVAKEGVVARLLSKASSIKDTGSTTHPIKVRVLFLELISSLVLKLFV